MKHTFLCMKMLCFAHVHIYRPDIFNYISFDYISWVHIFLLIRVRACKKYYNFLLRNKKEILISIKNHKPTNIYCSNQYVPEHDCSMLFYSSSAARTHIAWSYHTFRLSLSLLFSLLSFTYFLHFSRIIFKFLFYFFICNAIKEFLWTAT
jgi:hypothetical protein